MRNPAIIAALAVIIVGCASPKPKDPLHFERHFHVIDRPAVLSQSWDIPYVFRALEVYPFTGIAVTGDTLTIAIQHFRNYLETQIYGASNAADIKITCHPDLLANEHKQNHIFPDAKGKVGVVEFALRWQRGSLHMIAVFTAENMPRWVLIMKDKGRIRFIRDAAPYSLKPRSEQ